MAEPHKKLSPEDKAQLDKLLNGAITQGVVEGKTIQKIEDSIVGEPPYVVCYDSKTHQKRRYLTSPLSSETLWTEKKAEACQFSGKDQAEIGRRMVLFLGFRHTQMVNVDQA